MANPFGRNTIIPLTNQSGASVAAGDVVVVDTTHNDAFTTSTAGSVTAGVGIAQQTIANGAIGLVAIGGYVSLVNVNASVTRGDYGKTFTVAKQATDAGASRVSGTFCQFLTGGTTPDAYIYQPDLGGASLTNPMTHEGALIRGGSAGLPTELVVGTAAYGLVSDGTDPVWAEILPWHVSLIPMVWTPDATTGTWIGTQNTGASGLAFPFYTPGSVANSGGATYLNNSSAAQNDAIAWDVVLAKGTWDFSCWSLDASSNGIITLNQDGSSMGTTDTYSAASAAVKHTIASWSVAATGKKRMQLLMATKNGSSSGYQARVFAIEFRRTA